MASLTASRPARGLRVSHRFVSCAPRSTASTTSGCSSRNDWDTTTSAVTNAPSRHRSASSTSTRPPAATSCAATGSGTQAPSIAPRRKLVGISLDDCRTTVTSPRPVCGSMSQPCSRIQCSSATSWVLPASGVAILRPRMSVPRTSASSSTTRATPPEAAPETIRRLRPWERR
ncbi:hypothetical protein SGLAM104S_03174 [Streptomyces glaucescens]